VPGIISSTALLHLGIGAKGVDEWSWQVSNRGRCDSRKEGRGLESSGFDLDQTLLAYVPAGTGRCQNSRRCSVTDDRPI
jgi:hypothetical protein